MLRLHHSLWHNEVAGGIFRKVLPSGIHKGLDQSAGFAACKAEHKLQGSCFGVKRYGKHLVARIGGCGCRTHVED